MLSFLWENLYKHFSSKKEEPKQGIPTLDFAEESGSLPNLNSEEWCVYGRDSVSHENGGNLVERWRNFSDFLQDQETEPSTDVSNLRKWVVTKPRFNEIQQDSKTELSTDVSNLNKWVETKLKFNDIQQDSKTELGTDVSNLSKWVETKPKFNDIQQDSKTELGTDVSNVSKWVETKPKLKEFQQDFKTGLCTDVSNVKKLVEGKPSFNKFQEGYKAGPCTDVDNVEKIETFPPTVTNACDGHHKDNVEVSRESNIQIITKDILNSCTGNIVPLDDQCGFLKISSSKFALYATQVVYNKNKDNVKGKHEIEHGMRVKFNAYPMHSSDKAGKIESMAVATIVWFKKKPVKKEVPIGSLMAIYGNILTKYDWVKAFNQLDASELVRKDNPSVNNGEQANDGISYVKSHLRLAHDVNGSCGKIFPLSKDKGFILLQGESCKVIELIKEVCYINGEVVEDLFSSCNLQFSCEFEAAKINISSGHSGKYVYIATLVWVGSRPTNVMDKEEAMQIYRENWKVRARCDLFEKLHTDENDHKPNIGNQGDKETPVAKGATEKNQSDLVRNQQYGGVRSKSASNHSNLFGKMEDLPVAISYGCDCDTNSVPLPKASIDYDPKLSITTVTISNIKIRRKDSKKPIIIEVKVNPEKCKASQIS